MILPVLHKQHENNRLYSYDDVYRNLANFDPGQIGVEIRSEDMGLGDAYLDRNYPAEMVHLARLYGARAFGFDWLGDELTNRPVPDDWWTKERRVKRLERSLANAPLNASDHDEMLNMQINKLSEEQEKIGKRSTAGELSNGQYDEITSACYTAIRKLVWGTPYADISLFYSKRDAHLAANVVQHLRTVRAGRVAIVTGADHHGPIMKAVSAMRTVQLVKVSQVSAVPTQKS